MLTDTQVEILHDIIDSTVILKSNMKPSEWYEANMVMPPGSAFPGPIRYDRTPYWREPVDCASPDHPASDVTIMGPAQNGKSVMVLNPIVGYTIALNPGNILFLTGHSDLTKKAMNKIDFMIEQTSLRQLIKPQILKARNSRTGDTTTDKEFRGGDLKSGSITNHNMLRQNDVMVLIADDLDAAPRSKDDTGSTRELAKGRTKAYEGKAKRYWVSTPQIKGMSNIEDSFNLGDKRYWNVDCEKCRRKIVLKMKVDIDERNTAGLTWKVDNLGRVIPKSVGYVCQLCGGFFDDSKKYDLLNSGIWIPTCEPMELNHQSYHLSGLYAGVGMTSWLTLATKWQACNPPGQARIEKDYQTVVNIDFGDLYEPPGTSIKSSDLAKNVRPYEIGTIPEKMSIADGNGKIVLITCAADLGGRVQGINSEYDDVRLDWEIVAWSESGSSYSIDQGSIGNFRPSHMGGTGEAEQWSYDISKPNNVWRVFSELIAKPYIKDTDNRQMFVAFTGIDTGFAEYQAFNFIDRYDHTVVGLKGDKDHKYIMFGDSSSNWKAGQSRNKLYMLRVGKLKDQLATRINLKWDRYSGQPQPPGYMNFPEPADGKYSFENYFQHFEAEHRKEDPANGSYIWVKKSPNLQNHFFDVSNYHGALKEIAMDMVLQELSKHDPKFKNGTWHDFSQFILDTMNE